MPKEQKDLYGLMSAEKYFYLNQVKHITATVHSIHILKVFFIFTIMELVLLRVAIATLTEKLIEKISSRS
jgi:hypothetical protein